MFNFAHNKITQHVCNKKKEFKKRNTIHDGYFFVRDCSRAVTLSPYYQSLLHMFYNNQTCCYTKGS